MEELKKNVANQAEKLMVEASNATAFLGSSSSKGGGHVGPSNIDAKVPPPGLGLSMTPHGFALGYGRGFF